MEPSNEETKVDLSWIIEKENELTSNAKQNLGDNYFLVVDLLEMLQGIKSFSRDNEVAHYFEAQIMKGFYLAVLNTIRRHAIEANLIVRHTLESIVLFVYSMEHKSESDYKIQRDSDQIVEFDDALLEKANRFFEASLPYNSKWVEGYKHVLNAYYSHANVFTAQFNITEVEGRIKLLMFDNYWDNYIWQALGIFNELICLTLDLYKVLQRKYESFFFHDWFESKFEECSMRQAKLKQDLVSKLKEENRVNFPIVEEIIEKLNEKYDKISGKNNE